MKLLVLLSELVLMILLASCVSTPPTEEPSPAPSSANAETPIDLLAITTSLGLESEELGYREKSFNTCEIGYGFSSTHACRRMTAIVIRYQVQCRDSEGTISDTDYELTPVVSSKVKWSLGGLSGVTATDGQGFGMLRLLAPSPQSKSRFRLTVNGNFLILRGEDVRRMVAPKSWCRR